MFSGNSFHFLFMSFFFSFFFFLLLGSAFFALFQACLPSIYSCVQSRCEAMQKLNQVPIAAEIICGDHWPMMRKHLFDVFSDTDPQLSVSHCNHLHIALSLQLLWESILFLNSFYSLSLSPSLSLLLSLSWSLHSQSILSLSLSLIIFSLFWIFPIDHLSLSLSEFLHSLLSFLKFLLSFSEFSLSLSLSLSQFL